MDNYSKPMVTIDLEEYNSLKDAASEDEYQKGLTVMIAYFSYTLGPGNNVAAGLGRELGSVGLMLSQTPDGKIILKKVKTP